MSEPAASGSPCSLPLPAELLHRLLTLPPSSSVSPLTPSYPPRGLLNASNRCFCLAVLQSALAAPPLLRYLVEAAAAVPSPAAFHELSLHAPTFAELLQFVLAYRTELTQQAHRASSQRTPLKDEDGEEEKKDSAFNGIFRVHSAVDTESGGGGKRGAVQDEEKEDKDEDSRVANGLSSVQLQGGAAAAPPGGSASSRRRQRRKQQQQQQLAQQISPAGLQRSRPSSVHQPASSSSAESRSVPPPSGASTAAARSETPSAFVPPPPSTAFGGAPFAPDFPSLLSAFQRQHVGRQEDAAELLHFLLDRLQEEATALLRLRDALGGDDGEQWESGQSGAEKPSDEWQEIGRKSRQLIVRPSALLSATPVASLCALRLRSCLHIPARHRDSITWQAAFMLPLDVPSEPSTLEDSLQRFFAPSEVDGRSRRGAVQRLSLDAQSLPPILLIHLKRFASSPTPASAGNHGGAVANAGLHRIHKLHSHVAFPRSLALPASVLHGWPPHPHAELPRYELSAVVVHHGETPQSGHYTAFVRHPPSLSTASHHWLSIDDARVSTVSAGVVFAQCAYLLTYTSIAAQ